MTMAGSSHAECAATNGIFITLKLLAFFEARGAIRDIRFMPRQGRGTIPTTPLISWDKMGFRNS